MFTGRYRIADIVFEINSLYSGVQEMCADYAVTDEPEMSIGITQADIDRETETSRKNREAEGLPPYEFAPAYLETLAVYRQMATLLIPKGILLFHGSVVAVDGQAYLFTARSGTGKSTHVALWRKLLGSRAVMVNDDKPLIRLHDGIATVYGTPWNGKHHLGTNMQAPLKAVCWLTRSQENHIEPIAPAEACLTLLKQAYRPKEPQLLAQSLALVDQLSKAARLYKLGCNMDIEAAQVAYNEMSKD